jgi:hypothetical protein
VTVPSATRRAAGSPHQHRRNDGRCRWPQPRRTEYRRRCPAVTATAHRRSARCRAGPPAGQAPPDPGVHGTPAASGDGRGRGEAASPAAPQARHMRVAGHAALITTDRRHGWSAGPGGPDGSGTPDPYQTGVSAPPVAHDRPTGDGLPHLVGARRCLARRAAWRGNSSRPAARTTIDNGTAVTIGAGSPALAGRTGQAAPDPYRTGGSAPHRRTRMPDRGWVVHLVGARRCLARRAAGAAHAPWPTRLARHAAQISRAALSTIARP